MTFVTKYQISAINSTEKNAMKNILDGRMNRRTEVKHSYFLIADFVDFYTH
jgi:hypothetical protein